MNEEIKDINYFLEIEHLHRRVYEEVYVQNGREKTEEQKKLLAQYDDIVDKHPDWRKKLRELVDNLSKRLERYSRA